MIHVVTESNPFSFLLRDVSRDQPIWIPQYGVIVTAGDDERSFEQIERAIGSSGAISALQRIEAEPEETYAQAASATRDQMCPTWLGLSRDMRIFEVGYHENEKFWGYVRPRWHNDSPEFPEAGTSPVTYRFSLGRGAGCTVSMRRWLDDGVLPILHGLAEDGDIRYELTAFVVPERSSLTTDGVRGTDYLVADGHAHGHMFTPDRQARYDAVHRAEEDGDEETVLCLAIRATNTAAVRRYAWVKTIHPWWPAATDHDERTGMTQFSDTGRVFCGSRLNGEPAGQAEMALSLGPGESATVECLLPHRPLDAERADRLAGADLADRLEQCRSYWRAKLDRAGRIDLPEPVIDHMVKAGLLHLDLICYGREPAEPLAPTIGIYAPIGSESAPIIQFLDAVGHHDTARRCLQYFLEKQHPDGFIQNFGGYMLETGAALWALGEHFRCIGDREWVRSVRTGVGKACEFIAAWRRRNMTADLRGRGFGMLDGKVADPEDPFHSFMLSGYAYLGLQRAGEMLAAEWPDEGRRWAEEAEALRRDIRETFFVAMARSPVIPLGDGSWAPSCPPWPESIAPAALLLEGEPCWTHGSVAVRDSLLGPLYLVFQEVIAPDEPAAEFLLRVNAELFCARNLAFSQPYYCRNDWAHLKRGDVKAFLKTWYNGLTSLADRQTFTWWEHLYRESPHKTHEEAWFLMQTRWMLWLEEDRTLRLLAGVPRAWLAPGKQIRLWNVASTFGPLSLQVQAEGRSIRAAVECASERRPDEVIIRLPHSRGVMPGSVAGGVFDETTETVRVAPFGGRAEVQLQFDSA